MFEGYRLPEGEVGVWTLGYWWGMYLTRVSLLDIYPSYYGAFLCVCWSPDGKYILTGGQDDLVSIWSLNERQIVARCQGHHSWITAVAFDPWRCDERNYRFGSVGEDCKLLLWDFSVGMLHRPKAVSISTPCFHRWWWVSCRTGPLKALTGVQKTQIARQRGSISAPSISLQRHQTGSVATLPRLRSDSNRLCNGEAGRNEVFYHPVEPRARTAQLPPVMVGRASALPSEPGPVRQPPTNQVRSFTYRDTNMRCGTDQND